MKGAKSCELPVIKQISIRDGMYNMMTILYTAVYDRKIVKEQIPKVLILRKTFLLYLSEMIDDS